MKTALKTTDGWSVLADAVTAFKIENRGVVVMTPGMSYYLTEKASVAFLDHIGDFQQAATLKRNYDPLPEAVGNEPCPKCGRERHYNKIMDQWYHEDGWISCDNHDSQAPSAQESPITKKPVCKHCHKEIYLASFGYKHVGALYACEGQLDRSTNAEL